ncbi:AAA family ATPase [Spirosoma migulaei]
MLRSLEIKNYRNLRHLTIEKLGRVNLLVGKNNTGKTSVLEAVIIIINEGSLSTFQDLVEERGYSIRNGTWEDVIKSYSSLFTDRPFPLHSNHVLEFKASKTIENDSIDIKVNIVSYTNRFEKNSENQYTKAAIQVSDLAEMYNQEIDAQLGLEININGTSQIAHLFSYARPIKGNIKSDSINVNYQFVKTSNNQPNNDSLWDTITLTDNEDYVMQALRILDENISRLAFIDDDQYSSFNSSHERKPIVRLKSTKNIIPLRSMGDGINRILTIILAMVNCENGYLLIDEFENGLHYSVQEKLWEIIFYLSERLNIQVFATTHSLDCVEAFSAILNNGKQDKEAGAMIRLENYEGNIEATVYDADEIQSTTRVHVDPR